jgi:hypothetical protein
MTLNDTSGKHAGAQHIRGGRAEVRAVLYGPTYGLTLSPGDQRLLSLAAGTRESAESGDNGRHTLVPHHIGVTQ